MKLLRLLLLLLIGAMAVSWLSHTPYWKRTKATHFALPVETRPVTEDIFEKLRNKGLAANKIIRQKGYNDSECFLLDMS